MRYANGHKLSPVDVERRHIRCVTCGSSATYCEYSRNGVSVSFWQYCESCWTRPGPHGDTPEERASGKAVSR